jgi:hypothetical protein
MNENSISYLVPLSLVLFDVHLHLRVFAGAGRISINSMRAQVNQAHGAGLAPLGDNGLLGTRERSEGS